MAHDLEKWRSKDVQLLEDVDFSALKLSDRVLFGLKKAGFKKPSPIQLEAIPLSTLGKDMLVQAKSGTGKTLVFVITALEMLRCKLFRPQVMIIVPTKEIAIQICSIIKTVGSGYPNLTVCSFVSGFSVAEDMKIVQNCQIVVGTPGRLNLLLNKKCLPTTAIRLLVFDEADRFLSLSFKNDLNAIFYALPKDKQVVATSATYPDNLKKLLTTYLREPHITGLNSREIALLGISTNRKNMINVNNSQPLKQEHVHSDIPLPPPSIMKKSMGNNTNVVDEHQRVIQREIYSHEESKNAKGSSFKQQASDIVNFRQLYTKLLGRKFESIEEQRFTLAGDSPMPDHKKDSKISHDSKPSIQCSHFSDPINVVADPYNIINTIKRKPLRNLKIKFSSDDKSNSADQTSEDTRNSEFSLDKEYLHDSPYPHTQAATRVAREAAAAAATSAFETQEALLAEESVSSETMGSHSEFNEPVVSDGSIPLTLDAVRKMSDEEFGAKYKMSILKLDEKSLVEQSRREMMCMDVLKKKFIEEGSETQASDVERRQKECRLKLCQERARLQCMQKECRRSLEKDHSLLEESVVESCMSEPIKTSNPAHGLKILEASKSEQVEWQWKLDCEETDIKKFEKKR